MKNRTMKHSKMAAMPPRTPPTIPPIGDLEVVDEVVDDWDASGAIDEVTEMDEAIDVVEDTDAEALSSSA